tara:strand:- start:481 stop:792 length:312 start_codon:yes stop_codon:yes gene_type:complete
MEGKYLITTDSWFYAPDGLKYRSAWGTINILDDSVLGLRTNKGSTNWYASIGGNNKEIIVAGCQIHYAVKCDNKPNIGKVDEFHYDNGAERLINRPTEIYIAE